MKMSKLFVETLREFPGDAEIISHKLLVKAGFIKKLTNGIYIYLPLMNKVIKKIENIIREEMDASGAQELLMPFVQPSELWRESGRWDVYGKELMRLKDRHSRELCLGPTHEEIITFIAREIIKSYKQLPVNLYQIQSKFRDEIRPRFGLLRGREFIMKDAYSFDVDEKGLDIEYEKMAKVYKNIFNRCGLETKMVQSDSGAIGGSVSHEFMVLLENGDKNCSNAGENDVFYCENCNYQANSNHAESYIEDNIIDGGFENRKVVNTPGTKTINDLELFLNTEKKYIVKTVAYVINNEVILALIRSDKQIEETKLKNYFNGNDIRLATNEEIVDFMKKNGLNAEPGYISAYNIKTIDKIVCDNTIKSMKNFVIGANENDKHIIGANIETDLKNIKFADIHLVESGELCIKCKSPLKITKGIEVGNIFKLGTKYSKNLNATYTNEDGKNKPFIMGCYGIGVSRTAQAAVEVHHDEYGIKWPISIAPYEVIVVPVNIKDNIQYEKAMYIYNKLMSQNVDVIIDDRNERAGVKFKDADLIGFPIRINVGKAALDNIVEFKLRENNEIVNLSIEDAINRVFEYVKK